MFGNSVTSYIKKLYHVLLNIQVTCEDGCIISLEDGTNQAVEMIQGVKANSSKVMLTGNGGSAAIASHMNNDLCKTVGVRAMVFTEPTLLTATTNDSGYNHAFERAANLWANQDDLMMAISSSGQSENILNAVRVCLEKGCRTITFSGFSPDNPLRSMGNINFYVPSKQYGYVESAHSVLTHYISDIAVTSFSDKSVTEVPSQNSMPETSNVFKAIP